MPTKKPFLASFASVFIFSTQFGLISPLIPPFSDTRRWISSVMRGLLDLAVF
jgi:hypothetical protein